MALISAIFVDIVIVQPLTGYLLLGGNPLKREAADHIARIFHVVAKAVGKLDAMYMKLKPSEIPVHNRLLPSPTYRPGSTFEDQDALSPLNLKFERRYDYEGRHPQEYRRPIFLGTLRGRDVVIKFCEAYGVQAHRLLADQDPRTPENRGAGLTPYPDEKCDKRAKKTGSDPSENA